MNASLKILMLRKTVQQHSPRQAFCYASSYAGPTILKAHAMKPGTPIPGLNFMKGKDPPVAMERSEYPAWVNDLAKPRVSLAKLRKMPIEESADADQMRYLKLTRRARIKESNIEAGA